MTLVEYHDPDGLFPVIQAQLRNKLPLRNLHWKSPSRPIRSIASLHVDFVPSPTTTAPQPKPATDDASRRNGTDGTDNASEASGRDSASIMGINAAQHKGQRHQIPGLRDSPYLKIYLLKCDDKEAYKATSRKAVREWLREYTNQSGSASGVDAHDAFEWLVVHVVLPDTPAAGETRISRSSGSDFEPPPAKTSGGTKWTGRKSSTILEKLKADFNHSSKSAPDRITQVRLSRDQLHNGSEPVTTTTPSDGASAFEDATSAWSDVITKMKTLILLSFTSRVAQYEDDVKQKNSQRLLPGWNFCTFFVLKEGLGRAFEAVGLFEDALTIYDELSAGLETVLLELEADTTGNRTNSFLTSSPALKSVFEGKESALALTKPLDDTSKPYRDLILGNNISVFDMRCYLFARQRSFLLKLASPSSTQSPSSNEREANGDAQSKDMSAVKTSSDIADAAALSSLCQRATRFVHSMPRLLRDELEALPVEAASDVEKTVREGKIEGAILSWTFAASRQILVETASPSFPAPPGSNFSSASPRNDFYPARRASLPPAMHVKSPLNAEAVYEGHALDNIHEMTRVQPVKNVELANAASHRAEIYMFQRRVLTKAAKTCELQLKSTEPARPLGEDEERPEKAAAAKGLDWLLDSQLKEVLATDTSAKSFYQILGDHACWAYMIAGRNKAAERLSADLAVLKFCDGDYARAVIYFNRLTTFYAKGSWQSIETCLLDMQAKCLKTLNRKDEHMRIVMALLARARESDARRGNNSLRMRRQIDTESLLRETVAFSQGLPYEYTVAMEKYLKVLDIDHFITLSDDQDGLKLSVQLSQLLVAQMPVDKIRARLINSDDGTQRDIWLETDAPVSLSSKPTQIWLRANLSTFGSYILDKLSVHAGKIVFLKEYLSRPEPTTPLGRPSSLAGGSVLAVKRSPLLCYPRVKGLMCEARLPLKTHVGQRKHLEVRVDSGSNEISSATLQLRASSAGLRIFHADASFTNESATSIQVSNAGAISLGLLDADSHKIVTVPWEVENAAARSISVRMEISYSTHQGAFSFTRTQDIDVELAVDVTVQDLFKQDALMSQFLVKPVGASPIHVLSARLEASDLFDVMPGAPELDRMTAVALDPACAIYKIRPRKSRLTTAGSKLPLLVKYRTMLDDAVGQITGLFQQSIRASPFAGLEQLLRHLFARQLGSFLKTAQLDEAALSGTLDVPSYTDVGWAGLLEGLESQVKADLQAWLADWHRTHEVFELDDIQDDDYPTRHLPRELVIEFEPPQLKYLHTASLRLKSARPLRGAQTAILGVGDTVPVRLSLCHTRKWDRASKSGDGASAADFVYEITAEPSVWLVAGQKRAVFSAREGQETHFDVFLVPVKPGRHLLPSVDVQLAPALPPASSSSSPSTTGDGDGVVCETDCITQCEAVVVIEQSQSTTVGVGQGNELQPGMTLLDSDPILVG